MPIQIQPLSPAIGISISELNLGEMLSEDDQKGLRRLLDEHHLLVFRNQQISAEQQVGVMKLFGPVGDENGDGKSYSFVSNVRSDGLFGDGPLPFHTDFSFRSYQPPVFSLYGFDVQGASVPTLFASAAKACELLPHALRARLEGMSAVHAQDYTVNRGIDGYKKRLQLLTLPTMPPVTTHPRITYPVLRTHPRLRIPLLYITELQTSHIEGLTSSESEALIEQIYGLLYSDGNVYTHQWENGDLVIWDNLAIQHGRRSMDGPAKHAARTLRRVIVSEKSNMEILAGIEMPPSSIGFKFQRPSSEASNKPTRSG